MSGLIQGRAGGLHVPAPSEANGDLAHIDVLGRTKIDVQVQATLKGPVIGVDDERDREVLGACTLDRCRIYFRAHGGCHVMTSKVNKCITARKLYLFPGVYQRNR